MKKPTHTCSQPCSECSNYQYLCDGCNPLCAYRTCDHQCHQCPAICPDRADLDARLAEIEHTFRLIPADTPTYPQVTFFPLEPFFPQIVTPPKGPCTLDKCATIGIAVSRLYTSTGWIRSNIDQPMCREWHLVKYYDEDPPRPLLLGVARDNYLDAFWPQRPRMFPRAFDQYFRMFTSLNYSVYHDHPRLEHLYNLRRSWMTYTQALAELNNNYFQSIPFVSWHRKRDLYRQLEACWQHGIHKIAINAQTVRTAAAWQHLLKGVKFIHEYDRQHPRQFVPQLTILFVGVAAPAKLRTLRELSYYCSFTTANLHIAALKHQRLAITRQETQHRIPAKPTTPPDFLLTQALTVYERFLYHVDCEIKARDPDFVLADRYYRHKHILTPAIPSSIYL